MARKLPTLANWQAVPGYAQALDSFIDSATGKQFLATLKHEFRAIPLDTLVIAGVDYMQVHAFRNCAREACQKMLDTIEGMSVVKEPPKRIEDKGWATEPLRREPEKDESPKATKKKK